VDILDQIDQALREVDEEGWFTDAMHWVPGSSSDAQEAEEFGGGHSPLEAAVWARLMDSYAAHLDEAVLPPPQVGAWPAGWISLGATEEGAEDLFEVPPELLRPLPERPGIYRFEVIGQVARELGPVVMPRSEPPPDHPLERVRQIRAQRGSGPPVRQRAPRRIDPRGTR
jgi:hypothetical protein